MWESFIVLSYHSKFLMITFRSAIPPTSRSTLCAGTFGRATSASGSFSGSGSLLSFAKLYKTAHAVITRSDVWIWSRRSKLRHGNLLFKTPNVCSIVTLALDRAVLKRLSASVLVASSGVIRNGRSGYPLSPNRTPLISWFSNLAHGERCWQIFCCHVWYLAIAQRYSWWTTRDHMLLK